jgi:hypothetical protein
LTLSQKILEVIHNGGGKQGGRVKGRVKGGKLKKSPKDNKEKNSNIFTLAYIDSI